jgi:hypothetical protein
MTTAGTSGPTKPRAEGYGHPVDPADQEAAPAALLSWAGDSADETEVTKAIEGSMVFVEDSVIRLAGALGAIPISDLEHYFFGPPPEKSE